MAYNYSLRVEDISRVTLQLFKDAYFLAYKDGITSCAPLGFSGDTILLFGDEKGGRKSVVSLRNYGNDIELLITDLGGSFIFHGRYHVSMGVEFIVHEYFKIFEQCKQFIQTCIPTRPDFANLDIPENVKVSQGWDMLSAWLGVRKTVLDIL